MDNRNKPAFVVPAANGGSVTDGEGLTKFEYAKIEAMKAIIIVNEHIEDAGFTDGRQRVLTPKEISKMANIFANAIIGE